MTAEHARFSAPNGDQQDTIKQCCARLYESDFVKVLLGESFHPGGLALTRRLGDMLQLTRDSRLLDIASGTGTSALFLAEEFGCAVVGVDYSERNVERANAEAARRGVDRRVRFERADAETLPFVDGSFDALMCECAFCTFPDKGRASREFARVLRRQGRAALSDITRTPGPAGDLADLVSWIACLADARSLEEYGAHLTDAGLTVCAVETHDDDLKELVEAIRSRLFAAEVLSGLKKINLPDVNFETARRMVRSALAGIDQGRLGYAIVAAIKPAPIAGQAIAARSSRSTRPCAYFKT